MNSFMVGNLSHQFKSTSLKIETLLLALDNGWNIRKINDNEYQFKKSKKDYSDNDILIKNISKKGGFLK
jgi:hypothetical protein